MTRTPRLLVPSVRREIAGQSFEIRNCERCTILLFDATEQVRQCGGRGANEEGVRRPRRPISSAVASVQIIMEGCRHCRVLIGACESSLFVRDCRHCDLAVAVQQLRTRDCRHLRFSLYTQTRPVIETSSEVSFSCLRLAYFSQEANFEAARLSPWNNRWSEVHDFNQGAARGNERHWRFLDPAVEAAGLLLSPLDNLPDVRPKRGVRVACLCRLASLRLPPLPFVVLRSSRPDRRPYPPKGVSRILLGRRSAEYLRGLGIDCFCGRSRRCSCSGRCGRAFVGFVRVITVPCCVLVLVDTSACRGSRRRSR